MALIQKQWDCGPLRIRSNFFEFAGDKINGHTHNFGHPSIVFIGSVRAKGKTPDGRYLDQVFKAPACFLVDENVEHEITALEPNTELWCAFPHRDDQGTIVPKNTGWEKAYV